MALKPLAAQPVCLKRGVTLAVSYAAAAARAANATAPLVFLHGGLGTRYNWQV